MNISQIEYFVETVKTGSIAQAARNLHVTSQTVSKSISDLEKELGAALLERKNKGILITELGEGVALQMEEVLRGIEGVYALVRLHTAPIDDAGAFVLGLSESPHRGCPVDDAALDMFRAMHSTANLATKKLFMEVAPSALKEGIADAIVVVGKIEDPAVVCRKIASVRVVALALPSSSIYSRESVSLLDVAGIPVAMPLDIKGGYSDIAAYAKGLGRSVNFVDVMPYFNDQREFLSGGGLILAFENAALLSEVEGVRAIPLSDDVAARDVYLAYLDGSDNPIIPPLLDYLRVVMRRSWLC